MVKKKLEKVSTQRKHKVIAKKTIKVGEEAYNKLKMIKEMLERKRGRAVRFSEVVEFLIKFYEENETKALKMSGGGRG